MTRARAYGKFFRADSVSRVTITSVNGKAFDSKATYAVVCDNFLINGNDTYYTLKEAKGSRRSLRQQRKRRKRYVMLSRSTSRSS